jgi:hypothetical protein
MYIDFISGNTTLSIGSDHVQNTDGNFANLVGVGYVRPDGIANVDGTYPSTNSPYDRLGVGIIQAIPGFGNISAYYTPQNTKVAANDIGNGLKNAQVESGDNSQTELLFIERIYTMLKMGGTCAVVVPQGVLFGSGKAFVEARKIMVEKSELKAVITMPSGVFKPYAGVSTSILIFTKTT